jgi:hypothetical protein
MSTHPLEPLRDCQKISVSTSWQYTIVPIAIKRVSFKSQFGHLLIGDLDAGRVDIGVKIALASPIFCPRVMG